MQELPCLSKRIDRDYQIQNAKSKQLLNSAHNSSMRTTYQQFFALIRRANRRPLKWHQIFEFACTIKKFGSKIDLNPAAFDQNTWNPEGILNCEENMQICLADRTAKKALPTSTSKAS